MHYIADRTVLSCVRFLRFTAKLPDLLCAEGLASDFEQLGKAPTCQIHANLICASLMLQN